MTLRLTIEERRYEQVRGELLQTEYAVHEARALPRAYRLFIPLTTAGIVSGRKRGVTQKGKEHTL